MLKYIIKIKFIVFLILGCLQLHAQVGINTANPLSTLDINGNLSLKVVNLNGGPGGSATQINDGVYISLTPTGGAPEFIVPNAASFPGRVYILRNVSDSVNAQLYSFGGAFFAKDDSTLTSLPLVLPFDSINKTVIIISDGINWTYIY